MLETEGAFPPSRIASGNLNMKIVQAAVLVLVRALGAMLYVKVKGSPEPESPVSQAVALPEAQPLAQPTPAEESPATPAPEPAPAPVRRAKKHARVLTSSLRTNRPSSNLVDIQPAPAPQPAPTPPV